MFALHYCYLFGQKTSISRCPSHEKLNLGLLMGLEWYTTTDYHFLILTENEHRGVLFCFIWHNTFGSVMMINTKHSIGFFYTLDRTPSRFYRVIQIIILLVVFRKELRLPENISNYKTQDTRKNAQVANGCLIICFILNLQLFRAFQRICQWVWK